MSTNTKKLSPAFFLTAVVIVLGIVGLITMIISSTMSTANTLYRLPLLVVLAVVGVALDILLLVGPPSWRENSYLSLVSIAASIALFTAVIGNVINSRILLISGLFSFNSGDTIGWSVFYITVASLACFLVAILLLIISAFFKPSK